MKKRIAAGLIFLIFLAASVFLSAASFAEEIPAFNPDTYAIPHYAERHGDVFPAEEKIITLGLPVTMGQCAPCHENLDAFPTGFFKGVNHNLHFSRGIACSTCHQVIDHNPDGVQRIPMRVCFSCHGLQHGPEGELAPGECTTCHTQRRKPSNHSPAYIISKHKEADTHECVMCHRSIDFCNDCHLKEDVRLVQEREYVFTPYNPPEKQAEVNVRIAIPEKMGDCYGCHRDIENFRVPGLYFNHEKHFAAGIRCSSCHNFYPHVPDKTYRIPMQTCYYCHQVTHGQQGVIAPYDCATCHPKSFYKKAPKDHTAKFIAGEHSERAYSEPSYCSMCHTDSFCQACHLGRNVVPEDHEQVQVWIHDHGKDYEKRKYCADCHSEKYCADCHGVEPMPHPAQYLAKHSEEQRTEEQKQACNLCHQDRTFCENCHHLNVASALLKKENCIKCHEVYELPMLKIPSRGHMVHAAHFEMTNTPPFTCDKCHALGYTLGHDYATFQLCKECHGAVRLGKLIAKWNVDNGELCYRCHRPGTGISTNIQVTPP